MISYRQSDILERLQSKAKEIAFDFHYDAIDSKFYLFIYDPDGLWDATINLGNHNFSVHLVNKSIRESTSNWHRCSGEFAETQMRVVHSVIDTFMASMQQRGYNISVKDDFLAKQSAASNDSKYFVIFSLSK